MNKRDRKAARKALDKAHERELERELQALHEAFRQWEEKEIDCWELKDRIHRFHDGPSRELYKRYCMGSEEAALAMTLANGVLRDNEVPASLYESLRELIESFRNDSK